MAASMLAGGNCLNLNTNGALPRAVSPGKTTMPYVDIKVTREGTAPGASSTTPEQKAALIKGVSDLLFEVLGKPRNTTMVVIDEVELENWGVGGLPVPEYRKQLPQSEDSAK
jgi:4-oxalocrotonate tautomerase